jgi:hypothetical protein
MENSKLSLDAFKAKAETVDQTKLLETVQGGGWSDCHGFSGSLGKAADAAFDGFIEGLTSN